MAAKSALVLGFALFFFIQYSAAQTVHTVGDTTGWRIPPNQAFYANWAAGKNFTVGDTLRFNFASNMDDVVRVTKRSFDLCSDDDDIGEDIDISPANMRLSEAGEYYFISSEDNHCQQGQKLAINVTAAPGAPSPPSANPPPTPSPTPGRAPVSHVVGDASGWKVQPGGAAFYVNWAAGKRFIAGDNLVFNFVSNRDDVVRVTKTSFDRCSDDDDIGEDIDISPATMQLPTPGEYYFISSENNNCQQGMKLAINVSAAAPGPMTPPSTPRPTPPTARPPPPMQRPVTHVVGDAMGWTIPQSDPAFYSKWAAGKTFAIGDFLVFNFQSDVHDVQRVTKRSYDLCNDDEEFGDAMETSPATLTLTTAGEHYYISSENRDCQLGLKLAINVIPTRSNGPATSIATPPTSGGAPGSQPTPGGNGPPNSSASTVAAALSAVVFGLVLNFF